MIKFTHEELRLAALRFARKGYDWKHRELSGLRLSVIASETVTSAGDIPDVIGWHQGSSVLIECKASLSDFRADAKKPQRANGTGMGAERYYFAPVGLLTDLPEGWGLIEFDGKVSRMIRKSPQRELDADGHENEKRILLSLIRRIKMREFLIIQREDGAVEPAEEKP